MRARWSRNEGFALVTSLWAALVLALIVLVILKAGRTDARVAHTAARQAELRALAQGAIALTELRLLAPLGPRGQPMDGTPVDVTYAGHNIRVSVQDQAGLIDLNFASGDTLRRLFEAAGANGPDAQVLADRIMDWREKGAGRRLNGAKSPDYAAAGFAYGPREAPFESVDELKLVMGMTSGLFDRIAAALTTYSQQPNVNLQVAPKIVLTAFPGWTVSSAEEELHRREEARSLASESVLSAIPLSGRSLEVTASVTEMDAQEASSRVTVRATGYSSSPFLYYSIH